MKIKLFLSLLFFICPIAIGQINQTIVFDTTRYPASGSDKEHWDFVGTFAFNSLPQPLKKTLVNFELEAIRDDATDWQIRLLNHNNVARMLSDTLFNWPGPHKRGDKYSGYIEFIPLMSDKWTMVLTNNCTGKVPIPEMMIYHGISFQWCLNEDGELLYLDQIDSCPWCSIAKAVFITPDTLHIMQFTYLRGSELCDYDIFVTPIPHIDDTSTIIYVLHANSLVTPYYDIAIGTSSADISYEPCNINYVMYPGDSLIIPIKFIPRLAQQICSINLDFNDRSSNSDRKYEHQSIICGFIFDNDGNLRYCGGSNFGHVPEDKYPKLPYPEWYLQYDRKDTSVYLNRCEH
ncbi:MAG: hypothetical protein CVT49_02020 [candidate division Zixibacteria bacterium HGW-Zixibacteria-1]|nr:MAG: hypothetical protein CVT49_02020 [candidate division Zixibacteria bacterium HGW-Zixibacteria-1]